jgi:hypothetical protein
VLYAMLSLGVAGLVLLVGAPAIARLFHGRNGDPVGLTRILQVVGVGLLIAALLIGPYNPENTAVPPPPDAPQSGGR